MFVVVKIKDSNIPIVVPEGWIQDLNQFRLKNYGANRNQIHLIYYNKQTVDEKKQAASTIAPNFSVTLLSDFDAIANLDECCFYGFIVKFWCKCTVFRLKCLIFYFFLNAIPCFAPR